MADPLYCTWLFETPCLKPEVWAAWWQAFLAGLAIWWAARIASSSARRELSRRVDVYVHLIEMASKLAGSAITSATAPDDASNSFRGVNLEELDQVTKSLRAISLHDAPDYRLLPLILQTAKICEELERSIKAVFDSNSSDSVAGFYSAKLKIDQVGINLLSIQAKVIGAEYKESIFPRLGAMALRKKLGIKGSN